MAREYKRIKKSSTPQWTLFYLKIIQFLRRFKGSQEYGDCCRNLVEQEVQKHFNTFDVIKSKNPFHL